MRIKPLKYYGFMISGAIAFSAGALVAYFFSKGVSEVLLIAAVTTVFGALCSWLFKKKEGYAFWMLAWVPAAACCFIYLYVHEVKNRFQLLSLLPISLASPNWIFSLQTNDFFADRNKPAKSVNHAVATFLCACLAVPVSLIAANLVGAEVALQLSSFLLLLLFTWLALNSFVPILKGAVNYENKEMG